MKGTEAFPSSILSMQPNEIIDKVTAILEELLTEEPTYFIVQVKVKPTHNIKVFLDGDTGLPIEKCTFFNRKLYRTIEEEAWFEEGDFSLEVSSPGVDEPLILKRQYEKNKGRKVLVSLLDGLEKEGILKEVSDTDITIEWAEGKGKKAIQGESQFNYEHIKSTIVQIQF